MKNIENEDVVEQTGKKLFTFKEPRSKFEIRRKILELREKKALRIMQQEEEMKLVDVEQLKENATLSTASSNQIKSRRYVPLDDSFDDSKVVKNYNANGKRMKTESNESSDIFEDGERYNQLKITSSLNGLATSDFPQREESSPKGLFSSCPDRKDTEREVSEILNEDSEVVKHHMV